jgi:hypothetical protein
MFLLEDFVDECIGDAAESETPTEERGVGFHVLNGFGGGRENFVDFMAAGGRCEGACYQN